MSNSLVATDNHDRRRYFISLMSESLIKKGVFFRLQKRIRVLKQQNALSLHEPSMCFMQHFLNQCSFALFSFKLYFQFKALGLYLLSIFSRRAEKKVRNIFISKINGGGLSLLNELVVDTSGKEIIEVLKLMADSNNYPIGIYCTAGIRSSDGCSVCIQ